MHQHHHYCCTRFKISNVRALAVPTKTDVIHVENEFAPVWPTPTSDRSQIVEVSTREGAVATVQRGLFGSLWLRFGAYDRGCAAGSIRSLLNDVVLATQPPTGKEALKWREAKSTEQTGLESFECASLKQALIEKASNGHTPKSVYEFNTNEVDAWGLKDISAKSSITVSIQNKTVTFVQAKESYPTGAVYVGFADTWMCNHTFPFDALALLFVPHHHRQHTLEMRTWTEWVYHRSVDFTNEPTKVPTYATSVGGAHAIVLTKDGSEVLCVKARNGEWTTVGGAIDPGENPVEALLREISEEVGLESNLLDASKTRYLGGYFQHKAFDKTVGDSFSIFSVPLRDAKPTTLKLEKAEVTDYQWVNVRLFAAAAEAVINAAVTHGKFEDFEFTATAAEAVTDLKAGKAGTYKNTLVQAIDAVNKDKGMRCTLFDNKPGKVYVTP